MESVAQSVWRESDFFLLGVGDLQYPLLSIKALTSSTVNIYTLHPFVVAVKTMMNFNNTPIRKAQKKSLSYVVNQSPQSLLCHYVMGTWLCSEQKRCTTALQVSYSAACTTRIVKSTY